MLILFTPETVVIRAGVYARKAIAMQLDIPMDWVTLHFAPREGHVGLWPRVEIAAPGPQREVDVVETLKLRGKDADQVCARAMAAMIGEVNAALKSFESAHG